MTEGLARALLAQGIIERDARIAAEHMVEGTARGYLGHGVERVLDMLDGLRGGTINANPNRTIVREGVAFSVMDADHGLGAPAMDEAVVRARRHAKHCGIGMVGVVNAGHIGVLGPWAEALASDGLFGVVMSSTEPAAIIPGGRTALLGTNPVAYAFTTSDGPVCADFATVSSTRSQLLAHASGDLPLAPGVAVDEHGKPTVDASAALRGGILPLGGGLRGTWITLLVSLLAGPVIGAPANHEVTGTRWLTAPPAKGDLLVAIDLSRTADHSQFMESTHELFEAISADVPSVRRPGTAGISRRSEAFRVGIPVSHRLAALLTGLTAGDSQA
ncbi:Ldh family oxidoreductase [Mycobacterium sp. 1245111.1]|uniref:Ldh family oxidoreductase n=1 Tax=Mycobacterium sp. 1245111.1 TaxID=1834073 RepID=UPI0018D46C09|nr:Ldh family oxidoreductase [Mycobacterium sp. 1245111.1]